MSPAKHRCNRPAFHTEGLGDCRLGQVGNVPKHERRSSAFRQPRNGAPQLVVRFDGCRCRFRPTEIGGDGSIARSPPQPTTRVVQRHFVQPSTGTIHRRDAIPLRECSHERFGRSIGRHLAVTGEQRQSIHDTGILSSVPRSEIDHRDNKPPRQQKVDTLTTKTFAASVVLPADSTNG